MNDEKWWQKKQIQLEIPNEKKPSVYGYCDNEKSVKKMLNHTVQHTYI